MFSECCECEDGKLCELAADENWSDSNSDSDSDTNANEVSFYKWETPDKHVAKVRIKLPFDEAVDMFKASITVLKKHIYSKRVQNREYNRIKEFLDHCEILVYVDYAESYKNVHQNEIRSAYFGNSIFSIFTACCYTKLLIDNGDGLTKDLVVVISESTDHN